MEASQNLFPRLGVKKSILSLLYFNSPALERDLRQMALTGKTN